MNKTEGYILNRLQLKAFQCFCSSNITKLINGVVLKVKENLCEVRGYPIAWAAISTSRLRTLETLFICLQTQCRFLLQTVWNHLFTCRLDGCKAHQRTLVTCSDRSTFEPKYRYILYAGAHIVHYAISKVGCTCNLVPIVAINYKGIRCYKD